MSDQATAQIAGGRAGLPGAVRGALWMLATCLLFATMIVLIRHVTSAMHPFQGAFFRNAFGLLVMLPWVASSGRNSLKTQRPFLHGLRALLGVGHMTCWFVALSMMPAADMTALAFTVPLLTTLGAGLFLGERVGLRRWAAVGIGCVGALLIVRPGFVQVSPAALLVLAGAVFAAAAMMTIKVLSRTESAGAVVLYMSLLMTPMSLVPALFVWETPTPEMLFWLALIGAAGTGGQLSLVRAFRAADASVVMPFDYSKMIFTAALGYLAFGEVPDAWVWVGATVIFCGVLLATRSEVRDEQARAA